MSPPNDVHSGQPTFDALIADLTRDAHRVQPKDALQFCANWFQSRLQEQRARTRDALGVLSREGNGLVGLGVPRDHYVDNTLAESIVNGGGYESAEASSIGYRHSYPHPNYPYRHGYQHQSHRGSLAPTNIITSPSPFGTLNVPGNALLANTHTPPPPLPGPPPPPLAPLSTSARGSNHKPIFQVDGIDFDESLSPTTNARFGYAGFDPSPSTPTPLSGHDDFLPLPPSNILLRRTSISAEPIAIDSPSPSPIPPVFPKTPSQLSRIKSSISNNFIFRDLDDEQMRGVMDAMQESEVGKDEVVIRQGDVGEYFYVVEKGVLECYIKPDSLPPPTLLGTNASPSSSPANGTNAAGSANANASSDADTTTFPQPGYHPLYGTKVTTYHAGTSFGELALMYGHARAATIISLTPCTLWRVDRITFRTIILKAAHRRRTMYESFLTQVPLLAGVSMEERSKIADALTSRVVQDGEEVVREGEMGDTFFFVEEGEAIVTKRAPSGEAREINRLRKGDYFGELSLINRQPRAATVSAAIRSPQSPDSPTSTQSHSHHHHQAPLKVAALDAAAFLRLLGPLRGPMERRAGENYGPEWTGYRFGGR